MLAKPMAARPTAEKVIAEINTIKSRPQGSGGGAQSLTGAAASVAEETAKREAAEAALAGENASRAELSMHSFQLLRGIADQLFAEIEDHAPQAQIDKREDGRVSVYSATLGPGKLRMTIGHHSSIPKKDFAGSTWDVVSGDAILVTSGDYTRSASLWYADVGRKGEYLWIEMGYWPMGGRMNNVPTHLDPGRDAALAASNTMHNWNLANPIRVIEGDGTNDFCQRWMGFLAQAANRKLAYPSRLPEA
jgi:eukaryotic-like serine/threonine-protein kinase